MTYLYVEGGCTSVKGVVTRVVRGEHRLALLVGRGVEWSDFDGGDGPKAEADRQGLAHSGDGLCFGPVTTFEAPITRGNIQIPPAEISALTVLTDPRCRRLARALRRPSRILRTRPNSRPHTTDGAGRQ